jgi:hypothetical protein
MLFDATKPSSSGNLSDLGALYISNPTTTLNCTGYASAASASRTPSAAAVMLVATMFALYAV